MKLAQAPMRVWLNRSLFPLDLISISPAPRQCLREVQLGFGFANNLLKTHSGDGANYASFGPNQSIDLFIHNGNASHLELPRLPLAHLLSMRKGQPLVITASWVKTGEDDRRHQMCITWSDDERRKGHRPRLAFGRDAELLKDYASNPGRPVTGSLLALRARVPSMRARDARARAATEARSHRMDRSGRGDQTNMGFWASSVDRLWVRNATTAFSST